MNDGPYCQYFALTGFLCFLGFFLYAVGLRVNSSNSSNFQFSGFSSEKIKH